MNSTLKTIILSVFCLLGYFASHANPTQRDSIIVNFGDKSRIIIYSDNRKELEKLMKYDLNSLLKDLGARLDTMQGETKIYFDDLDGRKYLKDTTGVSKDNNYVRISLKGIRIKDGDTEVTITTRGVDIKDGDEQVRIGGKRDGYEIDTTARDGDRGGDRNYNNDDNNVMKIRRVRRYSSPRKGFNLALGLNAYSENQAQGYNMELYDLRPFGSRYIALGYVKSAPLARGENAGLHLDFGLDVAWNNLMFEGNNTVYKDLPSVTFSEVRNTAFQGLDLRKSKLVVPYANFSLVPTVSFSNAFLTHISLGGYVGYRLGGYTRVKMPDGQKERVRSNYYLNDFRYGAAFELGIKNFPDLFVHYDLNTLFQENRGPQVRMINFGIRF